MADRPQGLRLWGRRSTRKRVVQATLDNLAWVVAIVFAEWVRRDLDPQRIHWTGILVMLPVVFVAQALAGRASGLYRGRWIFGSFEEVAAMGRTIAVAATVLLFVDVLPLSGTHPIAIGAVIVGALTAFLLQGAFRYA